MDEGEYRPHDVKDRPGRPMGLYWDGSVFCNLKVLCLTSNLKYSNAYNKPRHITAGKVLRDVLHCMLNLHEAGVQLNLEVGNGK